MKDTTRRVLLSCFICLNLGTVLYMNSPSSVEAIAGRALASLPGGGLARLAGRADARYAHLVGLDNRWQMFGRQSRFNWWYVFRGQYRDGSTVVLPVEGQLPRTFWQRHLFDFKEAKFQLNIYPSNQAKRAYAHYLCGQLPSNNGWPIEAVLVELHSQDIVTRDVAERTGDHRAPAVRADVMGRVSCPRT